MAAKRPEGSHNAGQMKRRYGTAADVLVRPVANIADATALDLREYSDALIVLPEAGVTSENISIYVCGSESGTYLPLYSADGTAQVLAAANGRAVRLPDAAFAAGFIKLIAATDSYAVAVIAKS